MDEALKLKAAVADLTGLVKVDGSNARSHSDGGKALVAGILAAEENSSKIVETELAKLLATKNELAAKVDLDGGNATGVGVNAMLAKLDKDALKKPFAEALLGTKDGDKLVLVEVVLGGALDTRNTDYGTSPKQQRLS